MNSFQQNSDVYAVPEVRRELEKHVDLTDKNLAALRPYVEQAFEGDKDGLGHRLSQMFNRAEVTVALHRANEASFPESYSRRNWLIASAGAALAGFSIGAPFVLSSTQSQPIRTRAELQGELELLFEDLSAILKHESRDPFFQHELDKKFAGSLAEQCDHWLQEAKDSKHQNTSELLEHLKEVEPTIEILKHELGSHHLPQKIHRKLVDLDRRFDAVSEYTRTRHQSLPEGVQRERIQTDQ